jgi:hypothetical protein
VCNQLYVPSTKMNAVINYDKAAGFLKNPPSLKPRLEFTNTRVLKTHVIKAFSQIFYPQSAIHRWAGLVMDPATYLLLEGTSFLVPINPGPTAIYPQWAAPTTVKMSNATFRRGNNYFLSYRLVWASPKTIAASYILYFRIHRVFFIYYISG